MIYLDDKDINAALTKYYQRKMKRRQKEKNDKMMFKTFRKSQRYTMMFTTTKTLKAL